MYPYQVPRVQELQPNVHELRIAFVQWYVETRDADFVVNISALFSC